MIRFGVVLFDGFDELDAIGPWEVLCNAARFGAPFAVSLVTLDGSTAVEASHGLRIAVDPGARLAPTERRFDWVVVPGGSWAQRGARGAWAEVQRGALPAALRELRAAGVAVASVCTGAMIASAAGITAGRVATTHHVAREALAREGARVVEHRVVDDGDLVTAGGVTSGLDLALWLTERLASRAVAERVQATMEYTRAGEVFHGPRSQHGPVAPPAAARGDA
jgi:transcriptional regulator GlxA family with amidase domain